MYVVIVQPFSVVSEANSPRQLIRLMEDEVRSGSTRCFTVFRFIFVSTNHVAGGEDL